MWTWSTSRRSAHVVVHGGPTTKADHGAQPMAALGAEEVL
jgi:hypothetical protein